MILEERDYRLTPGKVGAFLQVYEKYGLPVQRRHLGEPYGLFTSEIGELNHIVAMWRYRDLADRETRRAAMLSDPDWPGYLDRIGGMIDVQNIRILKPSGFFELR